MSNVANFGILALSDGAVLDVGGSALIVQQSVFVQLQYSHSGLNASTFFPGKTIRDAIYVLGRNGRATTSAYTIVGSELRNLATGITTGVTAAVRPGRPDVVDLSVVGPAASEGDYYELRTVLSFGGETYEHARLYQAVLPLTDVVAKLRQVHDVVYADRYVVHESEGFAQYLVTPGSGDYASGTVVAAQDLFTVDGQRVTDITDFHARVVHR